MHLIALLMISAGILDQFASWISYLGCMTLGLCGVMIADFYVVRGMIPHSAEDGVERWNWAGVITLVTTTVIGCYLIMTGLFPLGFMVTFALAVIFYPVLRKLMPHGTATNVADNDEALMETC